VILSTRTRLYSVTPKGFRKLQALEVKGYVSYMSTPRVNLLLYSCDTVPSSKALFVDGVTLSEDEHLAAMDESDETRTCSLQFIRTSVGTELRYASAKPSADITTHKRESVHTA